MGTIHVIGAGLAGLSCALRASLAGRKVAVYEAAGHAGGRCRSFHDESLDCVIDNGSHMLMGANEATQTYLADIGSEDKIREISPAAFPFVDIKSGQRWRVQPGNGPLPFWLLSGSRRVAGSSLGDYASVVRLARAGPLDTVAECVGTDSILYERLWVPICRAVLNTDPKEGSAQLLWKMVSMTIMKGEAASRPLFFHEGLAPALIDPAVEMLGKLGVEVRLKARLKAVGWSNYQLNALHFAEGVLKVGPEDIVVLAVPPDICRQLWPHATTPTESRPIVNVHFRLDRRPDMPWDTPILGLINAEAEWLFLRDNILSVTVSAAENLVDAQNIEIANRLWHEAATALGLKEGRLPPWRVIKEKRATFAQTPQQLGLRPGPDTDLRNLFLAGDWTATGLPATIESSIRSGYNAAQAALSVEPKEDAA